MEMTAPLIYARGVSQHVIPVPLYFIITLPSSFKSQTFHMGDIPIAHFFQPSAMCAIFLFSEPLNTWPALIRL